MRFQRLLVALPIAAVVGLFACIGSGHNPTIVVADDAEAGGDDADAEGTGDDTSTPDDVVVSDLCTLSDGTDPVALCVQQKVLGNELHYAYTKGQGVASSWASTAPYAAGTTHAVLDDVGLAGALGAYLCSSAVYGNNSSTTAFDAALLDLAQLLPQELVASPLVGYDGETYFRLRWAQAGFYLVNNVAAGTIQGLADAYGASLQTQAHTIAASGSSPGGVVIGTPNGDGTVTYAPVQTMMAATALLDMAVQHWSDPDAGTEPSQWATTAAAVIAYVQARGRDPQTGLYYQSLVTSADAGHDALAPAVPTSDTELGDDQAWIVLALTRAQDLLAQLQAEPSDSGADAGPPDGSASTEQAYLTAANALVAAMTTTALFDGSATPPTPPPPGAFMEGLVASTGQVLTDKTTAENAILLGAFHRANGLSSLLGYEVGELRAAVVQTTPVSSSLLSVVTESNTNVQQAYLTAASKTWGYAVSFSDAGAGAVEPGATDYDTDAVIAAIEGLNELWYGSSHSAPCVP